MYSKKTPLLIALVMVLLTACACAESLDYADETMWAYTGAEQDMPVDVFFIAPTNVSGSAEEMNADVLNEEERAAILWGIGMQTQLYNQSARFFAPYYRQMTLYCYSLTEAERSDALAVAQEDVLAAFSYYWENDNNGRPLILAGFSQGAELGLALMKEYADNADFQNQLVAAYLLGWRVTEDDLQECPTLQMAQGESDTGVIIAFECEAEDVSDTVIVPEGVFTYSINPLNWKTDATPAGKEENMGYVYPAKDGSVKQEIPNLCGAWIDPVRGTLKVTDVSPEDYPPRLAFLPTGSYHIYDYEFFYRNLQQNIQTRIDAYMAE